MHDVTQVVSRHEIKFLFTSVCLLWWRRMEFFQLCGTSEVLSGLEDVTIASDNKWQITGLAPDFFSQVASRSTAAKQI